MNVSDGDDQAESDERVLHGDDQVGSDGSLSDGYNQEESSSYSTQLGEWLRTNMDYNMPGKQKSSAQPHSNAIVEIARS